MNIGEHGVIGNLETVAMVGLDGTIDYLCWPKLDSQSVFASLLDPERGGCFEIAPLPATDARQMYLPATNVLSTIWRTGAASIELIDLMPMGDDRAASRQLIRLVRAHRGSAEITVRCEPRSGYGARAAETIPFAHGIRFIDGELSLRLSSTHELTEAGGAAIARFTLRDGERAAFVLDEGATADLPLDLPALEHLIEQTRTAWERWTAQSDYRGRWRDQMTRSALALKLLTSREHGSIAAAATFGLPEKIGGDLNWDYRATWMRDAAFTVYAFVRLGHVDEVKHFMRWLGERTRTVDWSRGMPIMFRIDGGSDLDERVVADLGGYQGSGPVMVGNLAAQQVQLDIYGELLDSVYLNAKYGDPPGYDAWQRICHAVDFVCEHWREPDAGIWETRGEPQHFLYSRLMCWVALDRALRLVVKRSLPADVPRWGEVRNQIHDSIWNDFWDDARGHFVHAIGSTDVDGALLLLPLVRFVTGTDPRWLSTLSRIEEQLVDTCLVYRTPAGRSGREGAFAACSFWYAECLARAGRVPQALNIFEQTLGLANHVGLYAEEFEPQGRQLGNFPQALTHLALISAGHCLDRVTSGD